MAKPKPKEPARPFTIRPPKRLYEEIKDLAEISGIPLDTYIVTLLERAASARLVMQKRTIYAFEAEDPNYLAFLEHQAQDATAAAKHIAGSTRATGPGKKISYIDPGQIIPRSSSSLNDSPDPDEDPVAT